MSDDITHSLFTMFRRFLIIALIAPQGGMGHKNLMISRPLSMCIAAALFLALAGCGSAPSSSARGASGPASIDVTTARSASGPIGTACLIHNRRLASQQRCGCVQAAADLTLSQSEQQRGVRFFSEPDLLQQIRQSDAPANERFWASWKAFSQTAEDLCRSS